MYIESQRFYIYNVQNYEKRNIESLEFDSFKIVAYVIVIGITIYYMIILYIYILCQKFKLYGHIDEQIDGSISISGSL